MSEPVSTIHYNDLIIEIYWESNVLVQNSGLWLILPNMTIRNVLYSLGFRNIITISSDVLDTYVSSAPANTIHISNKPSSTLDIVTLDIVTPNCLTYITKCTMI